MRSRSRAPLFFIVGRTIGERYIDRLHRGRGGRAVAWIERAFQRHPVLVVFVHPSALVCGLAGMAEVNAISFVLAALASTITSVLCVRVSGARARESFELFQRKDDPHKFMFLERWTSLEAHHENMAKNVVASGHLDKIQPLLAGPTDNGVIEEV